MVKCVIDCLSFLKRFLKNTHNEVSQPNIQEIQINNDAINVTSMNDKEIVVKSLPGINHEAEFELRNSIRSNIITGTGIISDNNSGLPIFINNGENSDLCLSPISKRSFSEDLSPIKIPSPTFRNRGFDKIIPAIFQQGYDGGKPKVSAVTPRFRLPRFYS